MSSDHPDQHMYYTDTTIADSDLIACLEGLWHFGSATSCAAHHHVVRHASSSSFSHRLPDSRALITQRPQQPKLHSHPLSSLFCLLDEDGDGRVSLAEIRSLLAKLGKTDISLSYLASLIESVTAQTHDPSTSNSDVLTLEFPQFVSLYASLFSGNEEDEYISPDVSDKQLIRLQADEDEIREAFRVYDRNGDGFISASELASVLMELGLLPPDEPSHGINQVPGGTAPHVARCQKLIDRVDLDGNGLVDLHEFKEMMFINSWCGRSVAIASSSVMLPALAKA